MEKHNKNSSSKIGANNRYVEKTYDKFTFRLPKGSREILKEIADEKYNKSINALITAAVNEKLNGGTAASIPDLAAYAKSAGLDPEDYILEAVKEKMKKQDETFAESIKRVKID